MLNGKFIIINKEVAKNGFDSHKKFKEGTVFEVRQGKIFPKIYHDLEQQYHEYPLNWSLKDFDDLQYYLGGEYGINNRTNVILSRKVKYEVVELNGDS